MSIEELIKQQNKAPKEVANEIVDKYVEIMFDLRNGNNSNEIYKSAKECALIAIEFKLNSWFPFISMQHENDSDALEYWQKVKTEITKL